MFEPDSLIPAAMEKIDNLIRNLFDNAEMVLDMIPGYNLSPLFLGEVTMSCADETQLGVELVLDEDYQTGRRGIFFRLKYQNYYIMEPIPKVGCRSWFAEVQSREMRETAKAILYEIQQLDASELEQRIKEDGMAAIDRMLLFRGRSESPEKFPASCLISAFGEVFHGVNGLNEYCKCQSEKSSPYVIKKTSLIEKMDEPNLRRFDYMICSDSEEAKAWMGSLTSENLEYDPDDPDDPPFITYVEGMRYMTIH